MKNKRRLFIALLSVMVSVGASADYFLPVLAEDETTTEVSVEEQITDIQMEESENINLEVSEEDITDTDMNESNDSESINAEEPENNEETVEENTVSTEKKYESSGESNGMKWTLNDEGELTISGAGTITNPGWDKALIKTVSIKDGVTGIGEYAFEGCLDLTSIVIPDSVTSIADDAFDSCNNLTDIYLYKDSYADSFFSTSYNKHYFLESLSLNKESLSLIIDETEQLTVTYLPEDAYDQTVTWSSSDESVATVKDGTITAVANGTSTITAMTSNGKSATCTVTVEYNIIDGANSIWTSGSDSTLTFRGNGPFNKFKDVKVDGKIVDSQYYDVTKGSTVITLHNDYLNTLSEGIHSLVIEWIDGSAATQFTVQKTNSISNTDSKTSGSVKTGVIGYPVYLATGTASFSGIGILDILRRKNRNKK